MHGRAWTADEDETMRVNFPKFPAFIVAYVLGRSVSSVYQRARLLDLKKVPGFYRQWHTPLWAHWNHPSQIAHRFKKGIVPANKGLRRPGYAPGRMATTQFRRGERSGIAVQLWKPIGTERITRDGYLERKVNNDLPLQARWKAVHRIVWEQAHGPIPAGHVVRFREGMKTTDASLITIDRLELLTFKQNMLLNTIHNYPKDIVAAVQMRGALNRAINRRKREASHER